MLKVWEGNSSPNLLGEAAAVVRVSVSPLTLILCLWDCLEGGVGPNDVQTGNQMGCIFALPLQGIAKPAPSWAQETCGHGSWGHGLIATVV